MGAAPPGGQLRVQRLSRSSFPSPPPPLLPPRLPLLRPRPEFAPLVPRAVFPGRTDCAEFLSQTRLHQVGSSFSHLRRIQGPGTSTTKRKNNAQCRDLLQAAI